MVGQDTRELGSGPQEFQRDTDIDSTVPAAFISGRVDLDPQML
jgi:hypothetical protein